MSENKMILKHPLVVRMFHYFLILSFIPLAATGVVLFLKPLGEESMNFLMRLHVICGVVLTLDAIAFAILGFDRLVLFTKRVLSYNMNDIKWFMIGGGYPQKFILRKKVPVPPMGKYNSGQKLFGVCMLFGGISLIITGLGLWLVPHVIPVALTMIIGYLHLLVGIFLTLFLLVHIFLGVFFFEDFKAMFFHGRIPYEDALEKAPLWIENDLVSIKKDL